MCVFVFRYLVPIGVVGGFTDADIVIPSPGPSLLSHISTVCSADHIPLLPPLLLLSRPALSFRWLSAPNFFQHGPRLRRLCTTPVRNGYYPSTPHYNSTFDAFDPPPLPSLILISVRPQPS